MIANWLKLVQEYTMHFALEYSKTVDWCLTIWKKGCAADGSDIVICELQDSDLNYVLAKGEVLVKDWLLENKGGY